MPCDHNIAGTIARLDGPDAEQAWREFLESYAPVLLQVARLFERDPDPVSDCFLHVCEQLSAKGYRRLRKFQPGGPASFSTWLRAVARNLCLDWHRKEYGRHRDFRVIQQMPALEQAIFEQIFKNGVSQEDAYLTLKQAFPDLSQADLSKSVARIDSILNGRQRWLLAVRRTQVVPLEEGVGGLEFPVLVADAGLGPEEQAMARQQKQILARAMAHLTATERLMIRLRFYDGLTLNQVGQLLNLGGPQNADRRVHEVLEKLKRRMSRDD